MSRLWTDGAEFDDVVAWDWGSISVNNTHARSGIYAYNAGATTARKILTESTEYYIRWGQWMGTNYADAVGVGNTGSNMVWITYDVLERPQANTAAGVVATATRARAVSNWNLYELYVKIGGAGVGRIILYQNGIKEIDFTGITNATAATMNYLFVYGFTNHNAWYDDWAVNDTTGGADNTWCGDGHIERLTPNGNGDVNNWTNSAGNKVNNYTYVDELPPNLDTDYVKSSTPAEQDMYNCTDFDPTLKIVTRVWAEGRFKDNASAGGNIKLGFKTGGTVYLCAVNRPVPGGGGTYYWRLVGDDALINPKTGVGWVDADLDAIQFVVECE